MNWPVSDSWERRDDSAKPRCIETLLKQMTLEEKIGQLTQYSAGFATGPGASNLHSDEMVAKGQVGSMFSVVGAEASNHYQHIAVKKSRLHIPILFGLDVIHGHRTSFPVPLAVAASWDPKMVETVAHTGAVEANPFCHFSKSVDLQVHEILWPYNRKQCGMGVGKCLQQDHSFQGQAGIRVRKWYCFANYVAHSFLIIRVQSAGSALIKLEQSPACLEPCRRHPPTGSKR